MTLKVLSAGAAQGVATAFAERLRAETGHDLSGTFGAVGMIREKFLGGEPADLVILTAAQIADLVRDGHIVPGSSADLGVVRTGVAVRAGDALPAIGSAEALRASLLAADAIYFPDPERATAGIHFARLLDSLGIREAVAARLRPFPNGATAMKAMAAASEPGLLGCTQVTEILYTPGVQLVAALPKEFELATVYTAAVAAKAEQPQAARMMIELLASPAAAEVRRAGGFEQGG